MAAGPDFSGVTVAELFGVYRAVLKELRHRTIIRTSNAPAGDYAEYLVARALGGVLASNSDKSYDMVTSDGTRVQVKCRVADETGKNPTSQLSLFRTFDFDLACVVLFAPDYTVERAVLIPSAHVQGLKD